METEAAFLEGTPFKIQVHYVAARCIKHTSMVTVTEDKTLRVWVSEQSASLDGVWLRERKSKLNEIPFIREALDQALLFERLLFFHSNCNSKRWVSDPL